MRYFFFFIALLLTCVPQLASAVLFEVNSSTAEPGLYQRFQVDVMLNPENQAVNALEARVVFPEELLTLEEIRDGGSIVTFWIEKPIEGIATEEGLRQVYFSGVIPGGFEGLLSPFYKGAKPGRILSLIFVAKEIGEGIIGVKDQKAYLHDGRGTEVAALALVLPFQVGREIVVASIPILKDEDPPEPFAPEIAQDIGLFEGKYFLVFVAQDKSSGIDHYELAERRGKALEKYEHLRWKEVVSPYVLKDQTLKSTMYVRAVDRAGNERIAILPAQNRLSWYENYFVWAIITIVAVLVFIRIWKRRSSKK